MKQHFTGSSFIHVMSSAALLYSNAGMHYMMRFFVFLLMACFFFIKMVSPVISVYKHYVIEHAVQQQDKTAEEENSEESLLFKTKNEMADINHAYNFLYEQRISTSYNHCYLTYNLLFQYFAVPTPPPWQIS